MPPTHVTVIKKIRFFPLGGIDYDELTPQPLPKMRWAIVLSCHRCTCGIQKMGLTPLLRWDLKVADGLKLLPLEALSPGATPPPIKARNFALCLELLTNASYCDSGGKATIVSEDKACKQDGVNDSAMKQIPRDIMGEEYSNVEEFVLRSCNTRKSLEV